MVTAVTLSTLSVPAQAMDRATPGARSIGDRLFSYLGNGGYDIKSYDVSFDYRPGATQMKSSVRIKAEAAQSLSEFSLDSAGQAITSVSVGNEAAQFRLVGEKLIVTPKRALPKGRAFQIDIAYVADRTANPASPAEPESAPNVDYWYNKDDGFALFGQPDRAHVFFPMNDHPRDKARVTLRITTPRDLQAVANGTLQSSTTHGDRTTYVYSTRDPIATQVVQAAVGRFKELRQAGPHGLPVRSYVTPELYEKAKPQLELIPGQLEWVESKIGSRYPFEAYGVLGVKGGYASALETATLPTFSAEAGLAKPSGAPTMLHELVHQYFGNAVSVRNWDDMWLSEGHATYYTFLYKAEKGHSEGGTLDDDIKRAYDYDKDSRPESGPPGRLKHALDVLGSTNAGGAVMLHGLRLKVGDAAFQKIERTFFDRFRHRAATTQDYIDVVNAVSGHDYTGYIKNWIYGTQTPPMPTRSN
ncbi:M1 family metallopeptidase [Streptomyces sp. NPDC090442]|uniref:M1 family metallopeptidase n=1 Tax=Streptomyces sp. NPDC090442 TaxID=3365962 RepID=UPI00381077B3